jgi:hypothetical protein
MQQTLRGYVASHLTLQEDRMSIMSKLFGRPGGRSQTPLASLSPQDQSVVAEVRAKRLTYLADAKIASLMSTCRIAGAAGLDGLFVEAGCALGGSTIMMATCKEPARTLQVYDVFDMIPPPTGEDPPEVHERYRVIVEGKSSGIDGDPYYGYVHDLYEVVQSNLRSFGFEPERDRVLLIKGLLQDTLQLDGPVAVAHIDVDWYDPVMTCLERIFPRLVVGGSIILDDYHDWGGCRKATDEFLQRVPRQFARDDSAKSLKLTRTRNS